MIIFNTNIDFVSPFINQNSLVVREGTVGMIECRSNNPSIFNIVPTWLDSDGNIVSRNFSLKFRSVNRDDAGTYECLLTRDNGQSRSTTVELNVHCKSLLSCIP